MTIFVRLAIGSAFVALFTGGCLSLSDASGDDPSTPNDAAGSEGGFLADAGDSGVGSTAAVCSGICQKVAAANCPSEGSYAECFANCQVDWPSYLAGCQGETSAFGSCAVGVGKVVCDTSGHRKTRNCDVELYEFLKCTACIPSTIDNACSACLKNSCCAELETIYEHPQYLPWFECSTACDTSTCETDCNAQYPEVQEQTQALGPCTSANCPAC